MIKFAEVEYQEHQKRLQDAIKEKKGLLLYWTLGGGKTLGAIGATKDFPDTEVVVPASLQDNFDKELRKADTAGKYHISSYEKFIKHPPNLSNKFLVVDEAHRLKNITSRRTQTMLNASKDAEKILLLTGTPIQNQARDIAPLINIITGEHRLPMGPEFDKMFLQKVQHNPGFFKSLLGEKAYSTTDVKNMDKFKKAVQGLTSYYKPEQSIEDYPSINERNVNVTMSPHQEYLYNTFEKRLPSSLRFKMKNMLPPSKQEATNLNAFISAARQLSNTTRAFDINNPDESPKIDKVTEFIRNNPKSRHIVYSNYLDSGVRPVAERLTRANIPYGVFTGEQSYKEKDQLVKDYNKGKLSTLLLSGAGGEGLDLKNTRYVHILEPAWNDPKIDQVIGRAARYKSHANLSPQNRHVDVIKYISDIPIEQPGFFGRLFHKKPTHKISADQYLINLGKQKTMLNNKFLDALKETSIENSHG